MGKLTAEFDSYRRRMNDLIMDTANTNIHNVFLPWIQLRMQKVHSM